MTEQNPIDETTRDLDEQAVEQTEATEQPDDGEQEAPKMFDEAYVHKLRDEAAKYRQRAQRADDLARELFTARVAATGRLADPTDLAYSDEALADPQKLADALDDLLTRKPHLASRTPRGDVGQGATSTAPTVDLAALLRGRA